jgi:hypothetical protein
MMSNKAEGDPKHDVVAEYYGSDSNVVVPALQQISSTDNYKTKIMFKSSEYAVLEGAGMAK